MTCCGVTDLRSETNRADMSSVLSYLLGDWLRSVDVAVELPGEPSGLWRG